MDIDILNLPQKCNDQHDFCLKTCVFQIFVVLLQRKSLNDTNMEAALRQPLVNSADRTLHSIDEFADRLGKKLGQHYGINDIRELL